MGKEDRVIVADTLNNRIQIFDIGSQSININQGIAGAWFDSAKAGQGFLIDINPDTQFIFIAWFTYEQASAKIGAPEQRWLTAQGNFSGGAASIPLFVTSGGLFDDPQATTTEEVGSLSVNFSSCTDGEIEYDLPNDGLQGQISITRVISGTEGLCGPSKPHTRPQPGLQRKSKIFL